MTQLLTVPLDGKKTKVERKPIQLPLLKLDLENPRIQFSLDTSLSDRPTLERLRSVLAEANPQYPRLKAHIEANGGIYNPIWVVPEGQYYRVIEGNSRTLAYLELSERFPHDDRWMAIDAIVLPVAVDRYKVNFIRLEAHLFGPTPWDAYEKARELWRLNTEEDYPISRLSELTKLSRSEIETDIQAYRDMEEQYLPQYGKPGEQLKFSYFSEFRSIPELKQLVRRGSLSVQVFSKLVGEGKFARGQDVRKLAMVWNDPQSRVALLDENMDAALDQLSQKNPSAKSRLFERVGEVIEGLQRITMSEYGEMKEGLAPAKVTELQRLHKCVREILRGLGALPDG